MRRLPAVRTRSAVLGLRRSCTAALLAAIMFVSACATTGRRVANSGAVANNARGYADSVVSESIAPGVQLHRLTKLAEPWRAVVLDIDLRSCVSLTAVKGASVAVGRATTSALLSGIDAAQRPIAAVNADFFLFAPPGVPVGPHIENGVLYSGPIDRAVFAMDSAGRPWIGRLRVTGMVRSARGDLPLQTWNRPDARTAGVVDARWGIPLDSTVAPTAWLLTPVTRSNPEPQYVATPLPPTRRAIVTGDTLLLVGMRATGNVATQLRAGDTVRVQRGIAPITPRTAVGGMPALLRDSVILGTVDSVSNAGFRGLNPRTAVGFAERGQRLLIAVIDGRQPGYSVGMSLRETADLFRALGATDAVNLDGGGSSAMVVRDARAPNGLRVVNKPSDATGERPVANALAVLQRCTAGR